MLYKLVEVNSEYVSNVCDEMECHINQLLKSGWEPVGGVSMHTYFDRMGKMQRVVYQAVVKHPKSTTKQNPSRDQVLGLETTSPDETHAISHTQAPSGRAVSREDRQNGTSLST